MKKSLSVGISMMLVFVGLLVPWHAKAVDSRAVELLQEGHKDCRTARLNRRADIKEARRFHNNYLELKKQAIEIEPDIESEDDLGIRRILDYCEKVGVDISRAEAMPIFQKGIEQCDLASQFLRKNDIRKAKKAYQKYLQQTGEAVEISQTLFTINATLSDVLRCGRVFNNIQVAEAKQAAKAKQIAKAKKIEKAKQAAKAKQIAENKLKSGDKQSGSDFKQLQEVFFFCKEMFKGENISRGPDYFRTGLKAIDAGLSNISLTKNGGGGLSSPEETEKMAKLRVDVDGCVNLAKAMVNMKAE